MVARRNPIRATHIYVGGVAKAEMDGEVLTHRKTAKIDYSKLPHRFATNSGFHARFGAGVIGEMERAQNR